MATAETVEIVNVQAISHAIIPAPSEGGVVVLGGCQGIGKSTAIDCVGAILSGKCELDVRDGQERGRIEGFGVTITIGRSTRRAGECEVQSLTGRLSLGDLIDPKLKDPEAADAKRIKALLGLANAKADPALFYSLVGGRETFDACVSPDAIATPDLVVMAGKIKRCFDAAARKAEDQAENSRGRAAGAQGALEGVDLAAPDDERWLAAQFDSASRAQAGLERDFDATRRAKLAAYDASQKLAQAEAGHGGKGVETAVSDETAAREFVDAGLQRIRAAELALERAQADQRALQANYNAAIEATKAARAHASLVSTWRTTINLAIPAAPSSNEMEAAEKAVVSARTAVETGAVVRRAKEQKRTADAAKAESLEHEKRAADLRDAAKGTDEVLSAEVAKLGTPLKVAAGRLVVATKRSPETLFHQLSEGERATLVIDLAVPLLGERGAMCIDQPVWEGLQPKTRKLIAEHCRTRKALLYAARVTDDEELTAEVM